MKYDLQTIKIGLADFSRAPWASLAKIWRSCWYRFRVPQQVTQVREVLRETPLILQIETINVCNALCIFCAYPGMQRRKGVMSLPLFQKIVQDYAEMGGGPVSLTPVVGDALLDPHLMERLDILARHPEISQVSVTTNLIALSRFSDAQVLRLLKLFCIQVSIGGLDPETYGTMYGVAQFPEVKQALERLMALRDALDDPAALTLAFRTNDQNFETRFKPELEQYRRRGVFISHIWTYANYSGMVTNDVKRNLVVLKSLGEKRLTCAYGSLAMSVCWDGTITACGCADFEGRQLNIGNAEKESLAQVWSGTKRAAILASFARGSLAPICRDCSAYQADTIYGEHFFKGIQAHSPLPLGFYHHFWGG